MHNSLSNFKYDSIRAIYHDIFVLERDMARKGTRKDKNKERQAQILSLKDKAKQCHALGAIVEFKELREMRQRINKGA
jgi:hypothetical protein